MFFLHKDKPDKPKDDNQQDQKSAPATAPVVDPADDKQNQAAAADSQPTEAQVPDVDLLERQVHALANGHSVPEAPEVPITPTSSVASPEQVDGMEYEPVMIMPDGAEQPEPQRSELPIITLPAAAEESDGPVTQPSPVESTTPAAADEQVAAAPVAEEPTKEPADVLVDVPAITAESTVAQWLDHPVGGVIFRNMLKQAGQNESVVKIVRHMQMQRLVSMSGGRFTQDMLDDMVRQANAGQSSVVANTDENMEAETPDTPETETPEPAPQAAPPIASSGVTVEAQAWHEQPTAGRFSGKTIIVTGAGSGIGKAVASRIVREGGQVIAVDISEDRLTELQQELPGSAIKTIAGDITSEGTIATIINTTGDTVHGLANVAGIMDNMTPLHEMSDDIWNKVMNVNLNGMMKLSRAVLPLMLTNHAGTIVNVGSEASLKASMAGTAYTVSKHAVMGLTKSMAFMYGPSGIRTNMVAPGAVMTNIEASFASDLGAERVNSILATMPAPAEASHLAASICFLLSDDSVNINGAVLPSDGGWSVQ